MSISTLCLIVAFVLAIYLTCVFPTQWLKIERIQQPLGFNKTILQISDMHVERLRISPARMEKLIRQEQPDLIALTGDFMDQSTSFGTLAAYLAVIRDSGIPCFAVLGNHDYHLVRSHVQWLLRMLRDHGIQVLRNQSMVWDEINIVGIDDFCTSRDDEEAAYQAVDPAKFVLVLTHDPNLVLKLTRSYHYLLSGHLHGKQFNVPFLFRLNPMGKLPRMGIYQGLHQSDLGPYYISKGMGQSGINARFLVRSEVTVHYL